MNRTEQTLEVLREKCQAIKYGEWPIKLIIHNGEIQGFDEIDRPIVKFRAKE